MLFLKILTQFLTGASGLIALLLDYKWHDKRRKIFKTLRNLLVGLSILTLLIGVFLTVADEREKNKEISSLKTNLDSANHTLVEIKSNGDTLRTQIKPILDLAASKFPNLTLNEALRELSSRINNIDKSVILGDQKVSELSTRTQSLEKRISFISTLELRVVIEESTIPTSTTTKETSMGIQSVVALFDQNKKRFRLMTDFQFAEQQLTQTLRKIFFIYKPEDPSQLLGKPIDLLNNMQVFAVNYSNMPEVFDITKSTKNHNVSIWIYLNGVELPILQNYKLRQGELYQGQINITIASKFSNISERYKKLTQE